MSPKKNKVKSVAREWVESIVIALILAVFIRTYFFQPFKIPSGSMRMTLLEGDQLFVNKLCYGPLLLPELHSPDWLWQMSGYHFDIQWPLFLQPLAKIRLPGFGHPQRGDVMVFVFPQNRHQNFIKRLIGLPGDQVEIRDGALYINGQHWEDPRIRNLYYFNCDSCIYGQTGQVVTVPYGHYFMMGDNSANSRDSRYWGFVDEYDIVGKADFLFWPPHRIRLIK
ncbi:MAG: signal peptidase I [Candidatus Omnitrophica bacterium]|nr:signal peptidase I [Candidatus Omnitrophota bacterium]